MDRADSGGQGTGALDRVWTLGQQMEVKVNFWEKFFGWHRWIGEKIIKGMVVVNVGGVW